VKVAADVKLSPEQVAHAFCSLDQQGQDQTLLEIARFAGGWPPSLAPILPEVDLSGLLPEIRNEGSVSPEPRPLISVQPHPRRGWILLRPNFQDRLVALPLKVAQSAVRGIVDEWLAEGVDPSGLPAQVAMWRAIKSAAKAAAA
jgi:hypothetical protein